VWEVIRDDIVFVRGRGGGGGGRGRGRGFGEEGRGFGDRGLGREFRSRKIAQCRVVIQYQCSLVQRRGKGKDYCLFPSPVSKLDFVSNKLFGFDSF
jgi:hypothetical protein